MVPIAKTYSTGYLHDCLAINTAYRHDHSADPIRGVIGTTVVRIASAINRSANFMMLETFLKQVTVEYIVQVTTLGGLACFSTNGVCCDLVQLKLHLVVLEGVGGIIASASSLSLELPYPSCSSHAKTWD